MIQDTARRAATDAWYPQFARVVWHATAPLRHALHRTHGVDWWCPTQVAPYSPDDPGGSAAAPGCADCVSEHGEILCITCRRYADRRDEVADPDGWVYRVAECLMLDRFRHMRVSLGALARTDPRGVVARVYDACASDWERHLARLILTYVGFHGPVPAEIWPYRKWLAEKALVTSTVQEGPGAKAALHDDIVLVLALMRARGGNVHADGERMPWFEAYVERPLGRRRRIDTISFEQGPTTGDGRLVIDPPDPGLVRDYTDRLVSDCMVLVLAGATVGTALRRVLPDLLGTKGFEVIGNRPLMDKLTRYVRAQLPESDARGSR
ncbi:hypothetical protein [Phytomonospora endophytica]|uniref:Uncharacterized protein n=1 Tax=Phytomonospora endophytica TaxID=714109 RepID=A0A841FRP2_9ACTN|nr:hypothetical protein [Phytomonospora endophytica]MBB6039961.1 hypothetical protein [Phytomonospora endophytica]GIG69833.1 hypothetical protein Pen01_61280 [Phytomonospora endophytica]